MQGAGKTILKTMWRGWAGSPTRALTSRSATIKEPKTCVVEIALRAVRDGQIVMLSRSVGNTEGREYAHFIWKTGTHSDETPTVFCEVFLSSGEELECHSENEFDEVVSSLLH